MGDPGMRPFTFSCSSEFVHEFVRGDRAALERVYLAYLRDVEQTVRACMTAPRSPARFEDVRDVVQDVFMHAFAARARRSFDPTRDYGPFLATLTRNLLVDRMRRRSREMRVTDIDSVGPESADAIDVPMLDVEMLATVRRYVSSLPALLRAVYEQRYVFGNPQEVACAALGLSRQRFRTLEKRLRAGFARELKSRMVRLPTERRLVTE